MFERFCNISDVQEITEIDTECLKKYEKMSITHKQDQFERACIHSRKMVSQDVEYNRAAIERIKRESIAEGKTESAKKCSRNVQTFRS